MGTITTTEDIRPIALDYLGERYARFRLPCPQAEQAMESSLLRYGQLSAIVVCEREEGYELLDGFKRLNAARHIGTIESLLARRIEVDERGAKAAIAALNLVAGRLHELEEARIVHSLVREDGLSQIEVAELLGRHKSWVCRRLAMIERLSATVQEELQVGLISASVARELVRLPAGNQERLLEVAHQESLTREEIREVAALLEGAPDETARRFLLEQPREALLQNKGEQTKKYDPRLSAAGNRFARQLGYLLEAIPRVENLLRSRSVVGLTDTDLTVLRSGLQRLHQESRALIEVTWALVDDPLQDG